MSGSLWHPIALANAVEPSSSAGVLLMGKELVLWRDGQGMAHVWEDRCPHRGMRLSLGFVRGDHLACLYHGWQYDAEGRCHYIPAHPDLEVPATITVNTYKLREWAGIVWAAIAPEADAGEIEPGFSATPVRSVYVDLPVDIVMEALGSFRFTDSEGAAMTVRAIESNLALIKAGATHLICGLQPVSDSRSGLHLALAGTGTPEMLTHFARQLEAFRASIPERNHG